SRDGLKAHPTGFSARFLRTTSTSIAMNEHGEKFLRRLKLPAGLLPCWIDPAKPVRFGEAGFCRVSTDVLHDAVKVLLVSDDAVESFLMPPGAATTCFFVRQSRGSAFHSLQNVFQLVFAERFDHGVNVVGHDDVTRREI